MKILVIADLHSRPTVLKPLAATLDAMRPEAVFGLGDMTDGVRSAAAYAEALVALHREREIPFLCISGNNDAISCLEVLARHDCLLDFQERDLNGVRVVGVGYHPPEEPFTPQLRDSILLTHVPPRRHSVPSHVTDVPRLHFAGHYHNRAATWRLNETLVVQVPSAQKLRAAMLELPSGRIRFIDLAEAPNPILAP